MNTCAICHADVKADTSCENCNPFTKSRWSRKLTLAAAGLSSVLSLWFILFLIALASATVLSSMSTTTLGLDAIGASASAAVSLIAGLGGSVWVGGSDGAIANLSFPNLVIPIGLWLLTSFAIRRFANRESRTVSNGIYFAGGAVIAILGITSSASAAQSFGGQTVSVGVNTLIPLFVVAVLSYVTFAGTAHWPILQIFEGNFRQYLGAVKRFQRVLWRVAVIAGLYIGLVSGTGLIPESPLYVWVVVGVALLVVMPTAAFVLGPFFLGVAISNTDIFMLGANLATLREWKNDGQWFSWLVVAIAGLIVLSSAIRSAANSKENNNAWWQGTVIGAGFGLATSLLGSIHFEFNFYSFQSSQQLGLEAVRLGAIFGAIGLVRGLFLHPVFHGIAIALNESPGAEIRSLLAVVGLNKLPVRKNITAYFAKRHLVVRKLAKYTAVFAMIGIVYGLAHPLAWVTQPFYDNAGTGVARFEKAIKTGEIKDIKAYFTEELMGTSQAVVGSSGLGDKSDLKIEAVKDKENVRKISWNGGKNYLELETFKSLTKPAFWGIIPQWDAAITDSKLIKMTGKYKEQSITNVVYGKKVVPLNKFFFVPGKVSWTPERDKQGFVVTSPLMFDSNKAVPLKFDYQLAAGKNEAIKSSLLKSFEGTFSDQCKSTALKPLSKVSLGSYIGSTGLVQLKVSGKGDCESRSSGQGVINFIYDATGAYDAPSQKWTWTFLFK